MSFGVEEGFEKSLLLPPKHLRRERRANRKHDGQCRYVARVRRPGLVRLMDRHVQLTTKLPDLSLAAAARQLPTRIREIPKDLRSELSLLSSEILEATTTMTRL